MLDFLWLIPALPLAGFLTLVVTGRRMPRTGVAVVGVGSVGVSCLTAILIAATFLVSPPSGEVFDQTLWTWIPVGSINAPPAHGVNPSISLHLDALSVVMSLVVTFVAFFILLYSAEFMRADDGYSRFFACMDLFVASMLVLVLAGDLLFLYLGWEGVGLCSYLLIGFWYKDPVNARAARKAFIVTRVGDVAFAVGLFLLFTQLGTLNIPELMGRAQAAWPVGSGLAIAAAALLLGGAVGKSAQLPLQTWLPDAMAGPTPVSALIHAATMVTAGVYLIARMHVIFELAPLVQWLVAVIGAATLLLAAFAALTQRDIKRVLAYSTMSQIGYMFLALGVGAWSAAIFHFMTHAFFKALLFLGAGVVIQACREEHDMFRMGGLRRALPGTFVAFLIGAASLSAVPLVTAGFFSKDLILSQTWSSGIGSRWLWGAGIAGALLTSLYTFRMVFLTFFGEMKTQPARKPGVCIAVALTVLAAFAFGAGFLQLPFTGFLRSALPAAPASEAGLSLEVIAGVVSLVGILLAWGFYVRAPRTVERLVATPLGGGVHRFWLKGWGFDRAYDTLFVRPFVWVTRVNRDDFIDSFYTAVASISELFHYLMSATVTGKVRWYAAGIAVGAVIVIAIAVFSWS
jgi:NADH-quinone oxidoreductase subunit L